MVKNALLILLLAALLDIAPEVHQGQHGNEGIVEGSVELTQQGGDRTRGIYGRRGGQDHGNTRSPVAIWITDGEAGSAGNRDPAEQPLLDQVDLKFDPSIVMVAEGGQVRIRNSDPVYHNVFSLSSTKRFDVGRRPQGDTRTVTFDQAGIVEVFCDIHPDMHANIVVIPPETIQWDTMDGPGDFEFRLPSGSYQLNVFATGHEHHQQDISVRSDETLDLGTLRL